MAVIAAGAWGTALSVALAGKHQVTLWTREPEVIKNMQETRENRRFLPGVLLPESLQIEADLNTATLGADLLIIATPLIGLRTTLCQLREAGRSCPLVWVCKGFEPGSGKLPHQVVDEELGGIVPYGVLTGPSFAEEVAQGLPTALALASRDASFARRIATGLHRRRLRIYAHEDLVGAEIGGAVKNVMAIAAGVCDGLKFGYNARAALLTRGLTEISRLGVALGGQPGTFMGLAGMGDLILTCTGDLSRNRRVGLALAEGKSLPQILEDLGHVAEGVSTAREVTRLSEQMGIEMPITHAVNAILHEGEPAHEAVEKLLSRDSKVEFL